jgi:hypothetical protein
MKERSRQPLDLSPMGGKARREFSEVGDEIKWRVRSAEPNSILQCYDFNAAMMAACNVARIKNLS